jgi:hypothetical protein
MGQPGLGRNVAVTGAQIMLGMEECAGDMGQPGLGSNVAVTGAQIML